MKNLPEKCPSCSHLLHVTSLSCENCETQVSGNYSLPLLARLTSEEQKVIIEFVKCSGSLKQMSKLLKLSYPTVRNRLDEIITKIKELEDTPKKEQKND